MGRKLNLAHLSEEECEQILSVIQKDFELRKKERERLNKIEEEVSGETKKTEVLSTQKEFNENCCMRCFGRFVFLFNPKVQCKYCSYNVCKKCSVYRDKEKSYICNVCERQRELDTQSAGWFYDNVKQKFKRFGSAKVVRSLYKRKTDCLEDKVADPDSSNTLSELSSRETVSDQAYSSPYSCQVSFEEVRRAEMERFHLQLNGIINDLHYNLQTQAKRGIPIDASSPHSERVLYSYKQNVASALSNLSHSLHLAMDNQHPAEIMGTPTAKDQYVREIMNKQVQEFVGRPIDMKSEENTSEYASEEGSSQGEGQSQRAYEEIMAEAIVQKIVEDHQHKVRAKHEKEEANVRKELAKLSNRATIEQLHDMVSESETDDPSSSRNSQLSESFCIVDTDLDISVQSPSGMSEYSDLASRDRDVESVSNPNVVKEPSQNIKPKPHKGAEGVETPSVGQTQKVTNGHILSGNTMDTTNFDDLDYLVLTNTAYLNENTPETKVGKVGSTKQKFFKSSVQPADIENSDQAKVINYEEGTVLEKSYNDCVVLEQAPSTSLSSASDSEHKHLHQAKTDIPIAQETPKSSQVNYMQNGDIVQQEIVTKSVDEPAFVAKKKLDLENEPLQPKAVRSEPVTPVKETAVSPGSPVRAGPPGSLVSAAEQKKGKPMGLAEVVEGMIIAKPKDRPVLVPKKRLEIGNQKTVEVNNNAVRVSNTHSPPAENKVKISSSTSDKSKPVSSDKGTASKQVKKQTTSPQKKPNKPIGLAEIVEDLIVPRSVDRQVLVPKQKRQAVGNSMTTSTPAAEGSKKAVSQGMESRLSNSVHLSPVSNVHSRENLDVTDSANFPMIEVEKDVVLDTKDSVSSVNRSSDMDKTDSVNTTPKPNSLPDQTPDGSTGFSPKEPVVEDMIRPQEISRVQNVPDYNDMSGLNYASTHRSPLPDFSDSEFDASRFDVDPDLISLPGRESRSAGLLDDNRSDVSYNSAVESQWFFKDSRKITAYDNFGSRRVGREMEGPVMMFVPKSQDLEESLPRVGEKTTEDLSDLSENEYDSMSSGEEGEYLVDEYMRELAATEEMEELYRNMRRRRKGRISEHAVQTDDSELNVTSQSLSSIESPDIITAGQEAGRIFTSTGDTDTDLTSEELQKKVELRMKNVDRVLNQLGASDTESPDAPKFLEQPHDIEVCEGEVAKFKCSVEGAQPIDVFWYREVVDLIQLEDGERCDIGVTDGGCHYVHLFNTTREDRGQYLCIAVNEKGQCNYSLKLTVKEFTGEKAAPEFIKGIQDVEVMAGQNAKFRCKIKGYPAPRVLWYKDGKRIGKEEHRYNIEKSGNRDHLLTVSGATLDDDAEYTVVARNFVGEARSSAQLIVDDADEVMPNLPSSQPPTVEIIPSPTYVAPPGDDEENDIYPDTNSLLALAEKISASRDQVSSAAEDVLTSATTMSSIEQELNEMDQRLNSVSSQVDPKKWSSLQDSYNNNQGVDVVTADTEIHRQQILQEHQDMQTAAKSVRGATSTAMDIINIAQGAVDEEKASRSRSLGMDSYNNGYTGTKRKSELISPEIQVHPPDDEVELRLTFDEFEKLFEAGKISRTQIKSGKVSRAQLLDIQRWLEEHRPQGFELEDNLEEVPHELDSDGLPISIDCGLKRVDSKRYKRDYVIGAKGPPKKKWEVQTKPGIAKEIVRNPSLDVDDTEEDIYVTSGRVYSLEERIRALESQVAEADPEADPETFRALEEEVAHAAAQVHSTEGQLHSITGRERFRQPLTIITSPEKPSQPNRTQSLDLTSPASNDLDSDLEQLRPHSAQTSPIGQWVVNRPPVAGPLQDYNENLLSPGRPKDLPADKNTRDNETVKAEASSSVHSSPRGATMSAPTHQQKPWDSQTDKHTVTDEPAEVFTYSSMYDGSKPKDSPSVKQDGGQFKNGRGYTSVSSATQNSTARSGDDAKPEWLQKQQEFKAKWRENVVAADPGKPRETSVRVAGTAEVSAPTQATRVSHTPVRDSQPVVTPGDIGRNYTDTSISSRQPVLTSTDDDRMNPGTRTRTKAGDSNTKYRPQQNSSRHSLPAGFTIKDPSQPTAQREQFSPNRSIPADGKPKHHPSSTILARAAFWDNRIHQEKFSDSQVQEEFPSMLDENFKTNSN